jgi:hypothetical protein
MDDDTYIYGGNTYQIKQVDGVLVEPYLLVEDGKLIKYFKSEHTFAVYDNESKVLTDLIFTMTCWSDDFTAYKVNESGIGYEVTKVYHGRLIEKNKKCNVDLNETIQKI